MEAVGISECVFADDLVLLARNGHELEHSLRTWKEALAARNMRVNEDKIKIMVVGDGNLNVELENDGMKLEQVTDFKYLGVHMQGDGGNDANIGERLNAASKVFLE